MSKSSTPRYYPIRKVVYYKAILSQAKPGRPACLLGSLNTRHRHCRFFDIPIQPACSGLQDGDKKVDPLPLSACCGQGMPRSWAKIAIFALTRPETFRPVQLSKGDWLTSSFSHLQACRSRQGASGAVHLRSGYHKETDCSCSHAAATLVRLSLWPQNQEDVQIGKLRGPS